eukprot:CAMPEP_0198243122 /NCGR_PEP_ID=MMETSP1446-20131203/24740_1 /TAXON_ID=1461542 ORGANISM="Unidentified sp, Strain CCMP2111" /NCGR_SAMPLE_ID=MMETSP1446 /ASSEMBLY_ACC=CAM_ASM_001112 /LENGTH=488 /DNA_ID=CAMNT_0043926851 /DNA_START=92 /DNA_END=1558 /DNA_ORIENTATION=+
MYRLGLLGRSATALTLSGLRSCSRASAIPKPEGVLRHVESLIKFRGGPISFSEYMQVALNSPVGGYYGGIPSTKASSDPVIGAKGDFVTSPEISQLFGEMIGLWCVTVWKQLGCPEALRIVELGPGKGTLMADMIRSTGASSSTFKAFQDALFNNPNAGGVHLVEVSPGLREKQRAALAPFLTTVPAHSDPSYDPGKRGQVHWHRTLLDVPNDNVCSIYIGHEFLDALPVHLFTKDEKHGWSEVLVGLKNLSKLTSSSNGNSSPEMELQLLQSSGSTPAVKLLLEPRLASLPSHKRESLKQMEVSGSVLDHAVEIAKRIGVGPSGGAGGAALFIDYGYADLPGQSSTRAIHNHRLLGSLLDMPGEADLTADVDFGAIRWAVGNAASKTSKSNAGGQPPVQVHGPVSQAHFLHSLGIGHRLQALLSKASPEQAQDLILGYKRLTSGEDDEDTAALGDHGIAGMGKAYKALAMTSWSTEEQSPPVGFEQI